MTFDGVSLKVPASWPVVNLARDPAACPRLDVHAVYLGTPGPDPACPAGLHGKTEAVQIEPANPQSPDLRAARRPAVIGGRTGRTNADWAVTRTIIDILPAAGTEVSLSYGSDRALARRIQATIRIGPAARPVPLTSLVPPATVPPAPSQGVFQGPGFDTCAAPSQTTLESWLASPYRAVGIYIGGVNRACAQGNLTASWTTAAQAEGWHYFPLYPGLQASCVKAFGDATITRSKAAAQGTAAAADAATQAQSLGIPQGTPIVYDMEAYAGCGKEVITFLNRWDAELHVKGYRAAVYESFSNIGDLVSAAATMTEPDVIYYADWDGHATTASSYMPAGMWTGHTRIHQYQGGHNETWGRVTLNIDNDQLNVSLGRSPVPVRPAFRIAVGINSNGSAEWFAKAANGTLVHAFQHPLGSSGWSATAAVGGSPVDIVGNPAVTAGADGSLALFARDAGGHIEHAWQQLSAPGGWHWGGQVSAAGTPGAITADPAAIRRPGGDIQLFVTTSGGAVATTRQDRPNDQAGWTGWNSLHGSCASSPAAFVDASGRLEVFCVTTQGTLAVDKRNRHAWRGWITVGTSPSGLRGVPAVVSDGSGQTEVFAAARSGGLDYAWQDRATAAWTWGTALAGAGSVAAAGTKITYSPVAAAWPGGQVAVFSRLANGQLGYILQAGTTGSAGWAGWISIGGSVVGSPAGWLNSGGVPEAAVLDANLRIAVSRYSAHRWSGWAELGGGF